MFKYNLQKTTKILIFNIYMAAENYHMLNFVWKKLFGKKIVSDDGHMRYLFSVNNKVERKYFDMYVDMLEDNYSDKGVRIDRSRIDFSSSEKACESILNLMKEQVDTVYEVKN